MKKYKVYIKGNYLYLLEIDSGELFSGFKKEVFIDKSNTGVKAYRFFNIKDWRPENALNITQLFKEDGSAYTETEFDTFYLNNSGGQDLNGYLLKANNLSDLDSAPIARTNLGLGTLATQNGIFSGESHGTNTGDETTLSIQTKRPLKTAWGASLEGSGDIQLDSTLISNLFVNDLITGGVTKALTAEQGKVLNQSYNGIASNLANNYYTKTEVDLKVQSLRFHQYIPSMNLSVANTWRGWNVNTSNMLSGDANTSYGTGVEPSKTSTWFAANNIILVKGCKKLRKLTAHIRSSSFNGSVQLYVVVADYSTSSGSESNGIVIINETMSFVPGSNLKENFSIANHTLNENSVVYFFIDN